MAKYNIFSQGVILEDIGKEIITYLNRHGLGFEETGTVDDISRLTDLFIQNGFAEDLEVEEAEVGLNYIWRNLWGIEAYNELHEVTDNPFLACPLNLCLYEIADKHNKTMKLHSKSFDMEHGTAESQYEVVDKPESGEEGIDPLVIENVRLYELAEERARKLERAYQELKVLRGILPICSSCKKIRDDEGYWQQVDSYITEHSEAIFSHGMCPDCMENYYPEYVNAIDGDEVSETETR